MIDALRLAFGTLTTWKVAPPRVIDTRVAGRAMLLAPLVMVPLVLLAGTAVVLAWPASPPAAVLATCLAGAHVLSTRGMHLDGIADTADGLSASYDRAKALAVMKTSDVGPSGVGAIVLALALQISALAALAAFASRVGGPEPMLLAAVAAFTSRQSLAWGCHRSYPNATTGGLGATVARSISTPALAASTVLLFAVAGGLSHLAGVGWWAGPVAAAAGLVSNVLLLARTRSRLGGMTGDVLGAGIEISFTISLATAALLTG